MVSCFLDEFIMSLGAYPLQKILQFFFWVCVCAEIFFMISLGWYAARSGTPHLVAFVFLVYAATALRECGSAYWRDSCCKDRLMWRRHIVTSCLYIYIYIYVCVCQLQSLASCAGFYAFHFCLIFCQVMSYSWPRHLQQLHGQPRGTGSCPWETCSYQGWCWPYGSASQEASAGLWSSRKARPFLRIHGSRRSLR